MTSSKKILVVDDSVTNNLLVENILNEQGYKVIIETNGKDALKRIADDSLDVILLDIMMPKMNGFEVLEYLHKKKLVDQVPIIVITAKIESKDVKKALELGAVDYIKKPIDIDELLSRVNMALKLREASVIASRNKKSNIELFEITINTTIKEAVSIIESRSNKNISELKNDICFISFKTQIEQILKFFIQNVDLILEHNFEKEKFSINELIEATILINTEQIEKKKIILEKNFSPKIEVVSDSGIITLMLLFIIDVLIANSKGKTKLSISTYKNNDDVSLKIYDSSLNYSFDEQFIYSLTQLNSISEKYNCRIDYVENKVSGKEITLTF